jgi:hypothetical protein
MLMPFLALLSTDLSEARVDKTPEIVSRELRYVYSKTQLEYKLLNLLHQHCQLKIWSESFIYLWLILLPQLTLLKHKQE